MGSIVGQKIDHNGVGTLPPPGQLLLHQYGISVVSAQAALSRNVPGDRERWESAVSQPNEQNSNYYLQNRMFVASARR